MNPDNTLDDIDELARAVTAYENAKSKVASAASEVETARKSLLNKEETLRGLQKNMDDAAARIKSAVKKL